MEERGKRQLPAGCSRVNEDYAGLCVVPISCALALGEVRKQFFAHEDTTNRAAGEAADGFNTVH